jgi:hypothetical protein
VKELSPDGSLADASSVFGTTAKWNKDDGTLTMTLADNTVAGKQYVFSFELKNPTTCEKTPRTIRVQTGCCVDCLFSQDLEPTTDQETDLCVNQAAWVKDPLRIKSPEFITKNIWQSNPYPCHDNEISVELAVNVDMPAATKTTIRGLVGFDTSDGSLDVTMNCDGGTTIAVTGEWTQDTGTFVFTVADEFTACTTCIVAFTVKNPSCCRNTPTAGFSISADMSCNSIVAFTPVTVVQDRAKLQQGVQATGQPTDAESTPLNIRCPVWTKYTIEQSSNFPCADNELSVYFAFNVPIVADSTTLTLSGLTNSRTAETESVITHAIDGESLQLTTPGEFDQSAGSLEVTVSAAVEPYVDIAFKFTVINPANPTCTSTGLTSSPSCTSCNAIAIPYALANNACMTIPGDMSPGSTFTDRVNRRYG